MAKRQHTIELNGQRYDALTGKVVSDASQNTKTSRKNEGPKHLDGFTRRSRASLPPAATVHNKTERSRTLMRTTVKKPVHHKISAKSAAPAATLPKAIQGTSLPELIKPERALRAEHTAKSRLISRFGATAPNVKTAIVPVKPAPDAHATPAPAGKSKPHAQKAADPFQALLNQASSHTQPYAKKPRAHHKVAHALRVKPGTVLLSGSALAVLMVGGFLAYRQIPSLALQVASTKAGIKAALPGYQPAGFSLKGPIAYNPGEVSINYNSNSDERNFKVVQRASQWNSDALLNNFVAETNKTYQTYQANGRTIYIYDGSNATWVDGGIWYQIQGKSSLSSDQLLRIANSL